MRTNSPRSPRATSTHGRGTTSLDVEDGTAIPVISPTLQRLVRDTENLVSNERYRKTKWYPWSQCQDFGISFGIVLHSTFSMETVFVITAAVASTLFFHFYQTGNLAANLDFTLVGAAIVFPVSFLINSTFQRRESALTTVASAKALLTNLCSAYCIWNWDSRRGRANGVPKEIYSDVVNVLGDLLATHRSLLRLPTRNRAWYLYSSQGKEITNIVDQIHDGLRGESDKTFTKLHILNETLKCGGMAGAESSRIEQYIQLLQKDMEVLQVIKEYRTPQVTRSLLRIFVILVPIIYGPYYAEVARTTDIGFGIAMSIITAWVLAALVHIQRSLEDPFVNTIIDGIDIPTEFDETYKRFETIVAVATEYEGSQLVVEMT